MSLNPLQNSPSQNLHATAAPDFSAIRPSKMTSFIDSVKAFFHPSSNKVKNELTTNTPAPSKADKQGAETKPKLSKEDQKLVKQYTTERDKLLNERDTTMSLPQCHRKLLNDKIGELNVKIGKITNPEIYKERPPEPLKTPSNLSQVHNSNLPPPPKTPTNAQASKITLPPPPSNTKSGKTDFSKLEKQWNSNASEKTNESSGNNVNILRHLAGKVKNGDITPQDMINFMKKVGINPNGNMINGTYGLKSELLNINVLSRDMGPNKYS